LRRCNSSAGSRASISASGGMRPHLASASASRRRPGRAGSREERLQFQSMASVHRDPRLSLSNSGFVDSWSVVRQAFRTLSLACISQGIRKREEPGAPRLDRSSSGYAGCAGVSSAEIEPFYMIIGQNRPGRLWLHNFKRNGGEKSPTTQPGGFACVSEVLGA